MKALRNLQGVTSLFVVFIVFALILMFSVLTFNKKQPTSSQDPDVHTYVNESGYSFDYTNSEIVDRGGLVDTENKDLVLMEVIQITPPVARNFKNHEEMIHEIFRYWSTSTSQYLYPERHVITGPIVLKVKSQNGSTKPLYRYEIHWINGLEPNDSRDGTHVWLFTHHKDTEFFWIRYDKKDEDRLQMTLQSFTVETK